MFPQRQQEESNAQQRRKSYERPRILFHEPLEVAAVLCSSQPTGKGDVFTCPDGPINS